MNDKQVLQDVAFNPAAKCSPTATQCPRCNNPHNACDKDAQPAGKDAWLVEAERLLVECVNHQYELGKASARNEPMGMGADVPFIAMQAHLRSHPAAPEGYALVPIEPTDAMCEAAWESEGTDYVGEHLRIWQIAPAYRAMIAAAGKE